MPHDFPSRQSDYLEQFIDYKVPVEMYSRLAEYDGSVIAVLQTSGSFTANAIVDPRRGIVEVIRQAAPGEIDACR